MVAAPIIVRRGVWYSVKQFRIDMLEQQNNGLGETETALSVPTLLDAMAAPMGLFGESGEISYANRALKQLIAERDWLWIVDRRLKCRGLSIDDFNANTRDLIDGNEFQASMVLKGTDKRHALLVGFNLVAGQPLALCTFVDPFKTHAPEASELKALYGLTENESQVTALIAVGLDYKEIAAHRNVAPETIRSYTKSIFRKLGVSSRANVVSAAQSATLPLRVVDRQT
jgi:DNA-binding CsgD family transcriptional regulator